MTSTSTARRRAPAMSGDERRAAIIEAALPLLAEHGVKVTTSQIAHAANIAEGTVFRVFDDKSQLIEACLQEAMRPDEGLAFIAALPRELPLGDRLAQVAHHMADRMQTIGNLMHALGATGYRGDRMHGHKPPVDREKWLADTTTALADLIDADAGSLRLPPRRTAQMFLGVVFSSQFANRMRACGGAGPDEVEQVDVGELIDVFLHGVLKD